MISSNNKNVPFFLMSICFGFAAVASVSCKKNQTASDTKTVVVGSDAEKANIQLEKLQGEMRKGLSIALTRSLQESKQVQLSKDEVAYRKRLIAALDGSKSEVVTIRPMNDSKEASREDRLEGSKEDRGASKMAQKPERKQVSDTLDSLMYSQQYLSSGAARFAISWSEPRANRKGGWVLEAEGDDDLDSITISGAEIFMSGKINLERVRGVTSSNSDTSDRTSVKALPAQKEIRSEGATIIDVIRLDDSVAVAV
ncbi:MAG: hypothetical protein NTV34_04200 [Proteobacteria bacterium]|nr:hypothetical protein [Pseudomonadota bacterium]